MINSIIGLSEQSKLNPQEHKVSAEDYLLNLYAKGISASIEGMLTRKRSYTYNNARKALEKIAKTKNIIAAASRAVSDAQYEVANNLLNEANLIILANPSLDKLATKVLSVKNEMEILQIGNNQENNKKAIDMDITMFKKDIERFIELVKNYNKFYYRNKLGINTLRELIKNRKGLNDNQLREYIEHILRHDNDERNIHIMNINSIITLMGSNINQDQTQEKLKYYQKLKIEIEQDYNLQEELRYLTHKKLGYNSSLEELKYNIYQKLASTKGTKDVYRAIFYGRYADIIYT